MLHLQKKETSPTLRSVWAFILLIAAGTQAFGADIRGVVADGATGDPLAEASLRLLRERDSSFVKGVAADLDGRFVLAGIDKGRYLVEASYVGFEKAFAPVTLADKSIEMDTIRLYESSYMLKETTVVGVKTPIKVMQDTVEYNADSYKTPPNAMVEDLLKRLPGVDVGTDGKITANGKEVKKILVDGKEFFSDDPKVASKNLPVNMVDKLQVVDRKSDMARITGIDDDEGETVINLTVKKGMKNGWFGNVEGGYGTDDRYLANFNANRFFDGNQFTLIGNANNTNNIGFTDGNGGRFRRFGGNNGITSSQTLGLNFNVGKDEIFRVGGDVMYSHSDNDSRSRQSRTYLYPGYTNQQESRTAARDRGHNLRADFRMEWKPDSFNTLDFRPNFSFNRNDSWSLATDTLFSGGRGADLINRSLNRNSSDGNSWEFGGRLIYNHAFSQHRGRSFAVTADYRFSNVKEDGLSYSHNIFYQMLDDPDKAVDTYDQLADNHTWSNSINTRVSWTEPLGNASNGRFLLLSYRLNYRWNDADKYVYRHPVSYPGMDFDAPMVDATVSERIDSLSNSFRNDFMTQEIQLGFKQVRSAYTLDVGVAAVPSMSRSHDLIRSDRDIPTRWVWNYTPYLRFKYKMSKTRSANASYRGRASQPTIAQLQPVADYSNPLQVVRGNPSLAPSFTHNINFRMQDFDMEHQRSLMLMANFSTTQNSIVAVSTVDDATGRRVTDYRNVNGVWSLNAFNIFSMPLRNKAWSINNNFFSNVDRRIAFNNGERNRSTSVRINETFGIAYRPQSLEVELRPNYGLQATFNSIDNMKTSTIHTYGGSLITTWYAPFGLVIGSDIRYTASSGYSDGFDTRQWMWNASLSYQFLRNRQATIALKAYDLLHQQQNVVRSVTASYIDDTEYNSLTRYFTLTFSYRFSSFGKGNEPSLRRNGPPMGPPPGGGRQPRF